MHYNPTIHHRRSIRLKGYNYSEQGAYFITICRENRAHIFGKIKNSKMILNKAGHIAYNEWLKTEEIRKNITLDSFIIMPNHIHGIIIIKSQAPVRAYCNTPQRDTPPRDTPQRDTPKLKSPSQNLGAIIRGYKSTITKQINLLLDTPGIKLLQRNYYERIIRNDLALLRIRRYIDNNPTKWEMDRHNIKRS